MIQYSRKSLLQFYINTNECTYRTLKQGDAIGYNGVEFLTIDPCSGLIVEVISAQDLITFMYNLGNDINLTPLAKV